VRKTEAVHEQSERRNHLGHAAAVIGGVEIRQPQPFELPRLLADTLNLFAPDERLVIFNLRESILRHFLIDSFVLRNTLASSTSRD